MDQTIANQGTFVLHIATAPPLFLRSLSMYSSMTIRNVGLLCSDPFSSIRKYYSFHQVGLHMLCISRYMLGLAAVPGTLQFIGFIFMPESPRWLVSRGRIDQAREVLTRMRGHQDVEEELQDIIHTVQEANKDTAGLFPSALLCFFFLYIFLFFQIVYTFLIEYI